MLIILRYFVYIVCNDIEINSLNPRILKYSTKHANFGVGSAVPPLKGLNLTEQLWTEMYHIFL